MLKKNRVGFILFAALMLVNLFLILHLVKIKNHQQSSPPHIVSLRKQREADELSKLEKKKKEVWPKYHKLTVEDAAKFNNFLIAANKGDPKAQINLAHLLTIHRASAIDLGRVSANCSGPCGEQKIPQYSDVRKDNNLALKWLLAAAEQGDPEGELQLAEFYIEQAIVIRASFNGSINNYWDDMLVLGDMNSLNDIDAESLKWLKKAADQGDANAMQRLGWAYYRGDMVSRDISVALNWFRSAADHGDIDILCWLALSYSNDHDGIKADSEESFFWFSACNPQADNILLNKKYKEVASSLNSDQQAKILQRVDNWRKNLPVQTTRNPQAKKMLDEIRP